MAARTGAIARAQTLETSSVCSPKNGKNGRGDARFRGQFWKTELCAFHAKGWCSKADRCEFAHGEEELQYAPDLTKTSLCQKWLRHSCGRTSEACPFAHGARELRATPAYGSSGKKSKAEGCQSPKALEQTQREPRQQQQPQQQQPQQRREEVPPAQLPHIPLPVPQRPAQLLLREALACQAEEEVSMPLAGASPMGAEGWVCLGAVGMPCSDYGSEYGMMMPMSPYQAESPLALTNQQFCLELLATSPLAAGSGSAAADAGMSSCKQVWDDDVCYTTQAAPLPGMLPEPCALLVAAAANQVSSADGASLAALLRHAMPEVYED